MLKDLSRATVVKISNELMADQKNELKEILKSVDHVCLTADVWSAPNRSFMGVTDLCHIHQPIELLLLFCSLDIL